MAGDGGHVGLGTNPHLRGLAVRGHQLRSRVVIGSSCAATARREATDLWPVVPNYGPWY